MFMHLWGESNKHLQNWQNLVSDLLLEAFHFNKFICQAIIIIIIIIIKKLFKLAVSQTSTGHLSLCFMMIIIC